MGLARVKSTEHAKFDRMDFRSLLPRFTPEPVLGARYPEHLMKTVGR